MIGLRLVVVCCLLWLCACDRAPRAKVIWHLGDSTASQVGPQLDALARARNRGDVVVEIARAPGFTLGRDLGYFVERIRAASPPAEKPDVVLIQLGSNDLRPDGDPSVFALVDTVEELDAAIAGLLTALPSGVSVLWIEPGPFVGPDRRPYFLSALQRARVDTLRLPDALYSDGIHFADDLQAATAIVAHLDPPPRRKRRQRE